MKKLNHKEQLFLLAYAGLPTFLSFLRKNTDFFSDKVNDRAICVHLCSKIALDIKRHKEIPDRDIETAFSKPEMSNFFNSLVTSSEDDPREITLITDMVTELLRCTDSGQEKYADFSPFLLFEYDAWLQLLVRIQKSKSVDSTLKKVVDLFIKEGFNLILHPALIEFDDSNSSFFPWFEKLHYNEKEKLIADAMKIWKEYEENGRSYSLSGRYGEEWHKAALEFAVRISSKDYVSKVFAEKFKDTYPEVYEKFKELAGLNDYNIPIPPNTKELVQKKLEKEKMQTLLSRDQYDPDELAKYLSRDDRVEELCQIIFTISTNISEDSYEHVRRTLLVLVADYQECNLVKKLSSIFTQTLEEKVDTDTLTYADVPPSILYVSNPDLHWLF